MYHQVRGVPTIETSEAALAAVRVGLDRLAERVALARTMLAEIEAGYPKVATLPLARCVLALEQAKGHMDDAVITEIEAMAMNAKGGVGRREGELAKSRRRRK